ncbi:aspartate-semialdehyde dehydrogenase [Alicyclobacillus cycloheptanicus]|uniref:Aspartate-semialdehyde dehydrogenase n=1 Tax=Alicyclobacillus cycloheptanicus TaxID=1457 RepID=A0ABT9XG58_9BACL|nr:aspartate-semialdehyde dehydrogenase [Alicyclobacillus cycloheptanicus]MDQ0189280.1 aspartate-semialdehyde dehydrogenase [Alicyclobacillus cycloheptanicus]WDM01355.1 aspartate-semialdehyde dehydrogenase [Alicyclobacillus cycloheptanicus]
MTRLKAAIVGATGMAGQQFVLALSGHPLFEVVQMVTSRDKRTYLEALLESDGSSRWTLSADVPDDMKDIPVVSSENFRPEAVDVIFTAVESDLAKELEPRFAATTPTFSTASAFRYEDDTPLMIPGVNDHHAELLRVQQARRGWKGFVLPIPNCTVTGLAITLQPLQEHFGIERVLMVSMQAVSGAGRSPGVRTLDSLDNIIPYIPKEEDKVKRELRKILGTRGDGAIVPSDIDINCICTRAAVLDGHTEAVFAGFRRQASVEEVKAVLRSHQPFKGRSLHSAAEEWIHVHDDPFRPQVRLDRDRGDGMTTSVGRLEADEVLGGVKYMLVSHNTKMGAGKGAVLLAECVAEQGLI